MSLGPPAPSQGLVVRLILFATSVCLAAGAFVGCRTPVTLAAQPGVSSAAETDAAVLVLAGKFFPPRDGYSEIDAFYDPRLGVVLMGEITPVPSETSDLARQLTFAALVARSHALRADDRIVIGMHTEEGELLRVWRVDDLRRAASLDPDEAQAPLGLDEHLFALNGSVAGGRPLASWETFRRTQDEIADAFLDHDALRSQGLYLPGFGLIMHVRSASFPVLEPILGRARLALKGTLSAGPNLLVVLKGPRAKLLVLQELSSGNLYSLRYDGERPRRAPRPGHPEKTDPGPGAAPSDRVVPEKEAAPSEADGRDKPARPAKSPKQPLKRPTPARRRGQGRG